MNKTIRCTKCGDNLTSKIDKYRSGEYKYCEMCGVRVVKPLLRLVK